MLSFQDMLNLKNVLESLLYWLYKGNKSRIVRSFVRSRLELVRTLFLVLVHNTSFKVIRDSRIAYEPLRGVPVSRNLRVRPVIWCKKTGLPGVPQGYSTTSCIVTKLPTKLAISKHLDRQEESKTGPTVAILGGTCSTLDI